MLPKIPLSTAAEKDLPLTFEKRGTGAHEGQDLSRLGAFRRGEILRLTVTLPRGLGAAAVVLRLRRDAEVKESGGIPAEENASYDTPFDYAGTELDTLNDRYELLLDTAALCGGDASGLFYYSLLVVRGADTLFSDTVNNADAVLVRRPGRDFRLLVYAEDYEVPAWFGEGVMYHVFVDRFFRGEGKVSYPVGERGSTVTDDWDNGIPQYPAYPGAPLKNDLFFGGNLWGVAQKLDYLASLGVKVIYLSPVFKAYSNHKYDTGDYMEVDPGFGGEAALDALIRAANEKGMKLILDGVFNHTGDDSRYFNRYGTYEGQGAYQSPDSPYAGWFCFDKWPDEYASWWGIPILPKLNHAMRACRRFFTGRDGVCAHYVKKGIGGWRLDVADELPDVFLDELRASVKAASRSRKEGRAVIIGEVWENAADKVAYGRRRRYLQGAQLDSVMNYPVRNGILSFVQKGDAVSLYNVLTELYASYPREVCDALMNLLGTHDTERILTVLGSRPSDLHRSNDELAAARLSPELRARGVQLLKIAAALQFTVFGIPSVYYGDEVGLEGCHDPFCRMPFPWHELSDPVRADILDFYRALGRIRRSPAFIGGDFRILHHTAHAIAFERSRRCPGGDPTAPAYGPVDRVFVAANRGRSPARIRLDAVGVILLSSGSASFDAGVLTLGEDSVAIIK